MVFLAIALDPDIKIGRQGVDHRHTHTMQATGKLVIFIGKLTTCVQTCKDQFDTGMPCSGWISTGMPRPLSVTSMEPSSCR